MTTLFISDLHLAEERPAMVELFGRFLMQEAVRAEALYILGDLFEFWIGDDYLPPAMDRVEEQLSAVAGCGVPLYFIHGNRDFLIGEDFAQRSGCRLLPDPTIIDLYGRPTLLMHGDTLCTDDHAYQAFRQKVRDAQWQRSFLDQSVEERLAVARQCRDDSKTESARKSPAIMDVNQDAVNHVMREHGIDRLIHGHTHRPAVHDVDLDGSPGERIVLGDWYETGSVLRCDASGCRLERYPS